MVAVLGFSESNLYSIAFGADGESVLCCRRNCRTGIQYCKDVPKEDGCFVPMCKTKSSEEEMTIIKLLPTVQEIGQGKVSNTIQSKNEENKMKNERSSIEVVVNNYFHAYLNADSEAILNSFDRDTRLLTTDNGKLEKTEMSEWIENLNQRRENGDIRTATTQITGIDIVGDMAFVKTFLQFEKFTFFDYLSLLKIDGSWKIVGKVYTVL